MSTDQRKAVKRLIKKSNGSLFENCYWCMQLCVWRQKLDPEDIVSTGGDGDAKVRFKYNGTTVLYPIVTVDHLLEKSKGGTNKADNLVPACNKCNSTRSNPPHPELWKDVCMECGNSKPLSKRKFCKPCQTEKSAHHIAQKIKILLDSSK